MSYTDYHDFKNFNGMTNPYENANANHYKILNEYLNKWITLKDWDDLTNNRAKKDYFFSLTTKDIIGYSSKSKSPSNARLYISNINSHIRNSNFEFRTIKRTNVALERHFLVKLD